MNDRPWQCSPKDGELCVMEKHNAACLKINGIVRLKNPCNELERRARFVLLDDPEEMGGSRVEIRLICDLSFRPIERVSIEEIEPA
jgi:hypothetical protein